ncbi:hypothetical protein PoB_002640400 [Plakobranchus ocellatus]|uniref:Uncharacterized protein n=1 Tax=Plakobranchus ocellatus TaxID=259542 RepID=A0AAV3ZX52_9GAST|nr:hypothetical protein PoB_002640400 [Plakobranchus ocellatus]
MFRRGSRRESNSRRGSVLMGMFRRSSRRESNSRRGSVLMGMFRRSSRRESDSRRGSVLMGMFRRSSRRESNSRRGSVLMGMFRRSSRKESNGAKVRVYPQDLGTILVTWPAQTFSAGTCKDSIDVRRVGGREESILGTRVRQNIICSFVAWRGL